MSLSSVDDPVRNRESLIPAVPAKAKNQVSPQIPVDIKYREEIQPGSGGVASWLDTRLCSD
jgi:hypothetical protein